MSQSYLKVIKSVGTWKGRKEIARGIIHAFGILQGLVLSGFVFLLLAVGDC